MAQKEIVWSSRAAEELQNILEFYLARNKSNTYSIKLLGIIDNLVKLIQANEGIGRISSDQSIRVIPFDSFLLFYQISRSSIEIMSVWDNRQSSSDRLPLED